MVKRLLLFFVIGLLCANCTWLRRMFSPGRPQHSTKLAWSNEPVDGVSRIQVVTDIPIGQLKDYYVVQILKMGFRPNPERIYRDNFATLMKRNNNYYVRLRIVFKGDTAVFSGEYGNRGIGSYYESMSDRDALKEEHIDWKNITYHDGAWVLLSQASAINPSVYPKGNPRIKYGF